MVSDSLFHSQARDESRHLRFALAVSLLVHGLAVVTFSRAGTPVLDRKIDVTLVAPPPEKTAVKTAPVPVPKIAEQYVSPSESKPEPPKETRLRSEHDSRVEKEQVHRGDPGMKPQSKPARPPAPEAPPPAPKRQPDSKPPMEAKLRLSDDQLRRALVSTPEQEPPKQHADAPTDGVRRQKFESAEPFQRSIAETLFRGNGGTTDFLPNIPDGDITLLNAKADQYAVFVRRVAVQVFGALRKLNWAELSHGELRKLRDFVTIEAVMDKSGKLVRVKIKESSGSERFDEIAEKAASQGSWDQNPPAEAAAQDGMIHFIFEARSWSRVSEGRAGEQRWLLLGTGLL